MLRVVWLVIIGVAVVLAAKKKTKNVIDMDKTIYITIEGWRHSSHSYALVCQHVALELIRRAERDENTEISFADIPKPWQTVKGIYSEMETGKLSLLTSPDQYSVPDVIMRFSYPIDLSAPESGPDTSVFVHATAEYEVTPDMFTPSTLLTYPPMTLSIPANVHIMTPSNWSSNIFNDLATLITSSTSPVAPIVTIPHGIDPTTSHSNHWTKKDIDCSEFRTQTGIPLSAFAFLHIGAGTSNKNIAMLVKTFIQLSTLVREIPGENPDTEAPKTEYLYPEAVLVLKTLSSMYPQGKENIMRAIREAQAEFPDFDTNKIIWMDDPYSNEFMSLFYRCANAYVSPYQAEGFNLPVLQSVASGTPVIVPKYGPTDEFTTPEFARYIAASPVERLMNTSSSTETIIRRHLDVDKASLLQEMLFVLKDAKTGGKWMKSAYKAAVQYGKQFTWSRIVDKMIVEMAKEKPELARLLSKKK